MLPCIDKEGDDGLFAKRLGGLQPVQTFDEHEARAVWPYYSLEATSAGNCDGAPESRVSPGRIGLERSDGCGPSVETTLLCPPIVRAINRFTGQPASIN